LREVRDEDPPLLFEQWAEPVAVGQSARLVTVPATYRISGSSINGSIPTAYWNSCK
jgi:hypothetical protein